MDTFIPRAMATLKSWLLNFKNNLPANGAAVGQNPTQIGITEGIAQEGMDLIDAVVAAKAAQSAAIKKLHTWMEPKGKGLNAIRKTVDQIKVNNGYNDAIGGLLGTGTIHHEIDIKNYKPVGTATPQADYILLKFERLGVDYMSIEYRIKGTTAWIHIGNIKESPYHHHFTLPVLDPPAKPAIVAVALEYRLTGVIHDVMIGTPSDTFTALFEL